MRGLAFGILHNLSTTVPSPKRLGGQILALQSVKQAAYTENVEDFAAAFVYEFPTLKKAQDWYQAVVGTKYQDSPIVVVKHPDNTSTDDVGWDDYQGFSIFFIRIHDATAFTNYTPQKSLSQYDTQQVSLTPSSASWATTSAQSADKAVLIAFRTATDGQEWLESKAYNEPDGILRKRTTTGPGVVIGGVDSTLL